MLGASALRRVRTFGCILVMVVDLERWGWCNLCFSEEKRVDYYQHYKHDRTEWLLLDKTRQTTDKILSQGIITASEQIRKRSREFRKTTLIMRNSKTSRWSETMEHQSQYDVTAAGRKARELGGGGRLATDLSDSITWLFEAGYYFLRISADMSLGFRLCETTNC